MKATKIIVAVLVLAGFGSCANRPSKSKAPKDTPQETTLQTDSTEVAPIRVMYGPPRRQFIPEKEIQERAPQQENTETTAPPADK